ncbi:hypothetical protein COU18_02560 [Candidatus Kaiserbacteria bacterium CG10_big_fil_rev_8_21_14_0_10_51_14]|uniref:Uncharacterized protein n=1 Tax=Candidatus Kaiserbacteria bacterium CG10_big_fil_rev_8_21_14_0_10_51_14 TaxID=1974610 RepID=A0A2H0UAU3_9BACT|nr:MAG: hypothetical protein COU18_02560 [Candidatus Kaiserbacteria bacterium CG10_big_fil_rev_8_21_14_0_10_51_14]
MNGVRTSDATVQQGITFEYVAMYRNPEIIARYEDELGLIHAEAVVLFADVKRFLYLCAVEPGAKAPTRKIDVGWHEFMLYSRDYREFCLRALGQVIDHAPNSYLHPVEDQRDLVRTTRSMAEAMFGELSTNWHVPHGDSESPCTACGDSACTWMPPDKDVEILNAPST